MSAPRIKMEKTRHSGIYKREGKTGTTYYVVAYVGVNADGRPKQKWHSGFKTLKEAKSARAEITTRVEKGTYVEPTKLPLREWVAEWLDAVKPSLRASTFESYKGNLRRHVLSDDSLAGTRLQQITPGQLNKLYATLALPRTIDGEERAALSPTSIRYVHTIVRACLKDAAREDRIARNPADRAMPPKASAAKPARMVTWTAA